MKPNLKIRIDDRRQELIWQLSSLGRSLSGLAQRLAKDPSKVVVNSCGEVQGQGSIIDRLCAEYCLLTNLQEELENK